MIKDYYWIFIVIGLLLLTGFLLRKKIKCFIKACAYGFCMRCVDEEKSNKGGEKNI